MKSSAVCFDDPVTLFVSSRRRIFDSDHQSFVELLHSLAIRSAQYRFFFAANSACLRWSDVKKTKRSLSVLIRRYHLSSLRHAWRVPRHSASNHGECDRTRLSTHLVDRRKAVSHAVQHGVVFGEQVVSCQ